MRRPIPCRRPLVVALIFVFVTLPHALRPDALEEARAVFDRPPDDARLTLAPYESRILVTRPDRLKRSRSVVPVTRTSEDRRQGPSRP